MAELFDSCAADSVFGRFEEGDPDATSKAREAANVRVVETFYRLLAAGDFSKLDAVFDPDVELQILGSTQAPWVGTRRGLEQVVQSMRGNFSSLADQRPEVESVVAQGDTVVVVGFERGRVRRTGKAYQGHWMHLFRIADGRIVSARQIFDPSSLIEAFSAD